MDALTGEVMRLSSILGLLPVCLLGLSACGSQADREEYSSIVLGGFSPDGGILSLTYCTTKSVCKSGLFDLNSKVFSELASPTPGQVYVPGGFSPDGKYLAVCVRRAAGRGEDAQIGQIELSTGRLTELTVGSGHRSSPSYSHDGTKIIFRQANRERESGKTRFSDWDIYELEIDKRVEHRLTAFRFFATTPPYYLPGDQTFIFSGEGPKEYVSTSGAKGYQAYKAQFEDNTIFVRTLADSRPLMPLFVNGPLSNFPLVTADGTRIYYKARTDQIDGPRPGIGYTYDLFAFDYHEHLRLTKQDDIITDVVLSPDGKKIAFSSGQRDRLDARELRMLDVVSGQVEMLDPALLLGK